jgi:hypothetical protein
MRPRKRIAVLGATELEAASLGVVLESRGYCVEICMSENAAMRIETPEVFLILGLSEWQRQRVQSRLRLQHRYVAFVMESHDALQSQAWMACMLERLKLAMIRHRGPRPAPKHVMAKLSAAGEVKRAERNRRRIA